MRQASERASAIGNPQSADPLPGLPEPDAWSRRWIIGCVVALLVGTLMPFPTDQLFLTDEYADGTQLSWPWDAVGADGLAWIDLILPVMLAALAVAALRLRGATRGMTLFFGVLAAQAIGTIIAANGMGATLIDRSFRGGLAAASLLFGLAILLGLLGVAVGNHLRKRAPRSSAASAFSGVGGCLLLLVFVLPVEGQPLFLLYFLADAWRIAWSMLLLFLLVFSFGLLGLRSFSSSGVATRCSLTSLVARLLLFGYSFAMMVMLAGQLPFATVVVLCLRLGLLFAGYYCLLATGLAAWIESSIVARTRPVLDSKRAAEVFG